MFFSCATRPTWMSSGRTAAIPSCARNAEPSPGVKAAESNPVGSTAIGVVTPYVLKASRMARDGAITRVT